MQEGNWSYNINTALASYNPGVSTGVHNINATYTNMSGVIDTVSITIDTTVCLSYPDNVSTVRR